MPPPVGSGVESRGAGTGAWRIAVNAGVAEVLIDRPPVNALTYDDWRALPSIVDAFAQAGVQAVVLAGRGPGHFSAGSDVREFDGTAERAEPGTAAVRDGLRAVAESPSVWIAATDGVALGSSFMLVCVCDLRVCTMRAEFGLPEMRVGSFGGYSVARSVLPGGLARRLALGGRWLTAREALQIGFVTEVLPDHGGLLDCARRMASEWAAECGSAFTGEVKATMRRAEALSVWSGHELERAVGVRMMGASDHVGKGAHTKFHSARGQPTEG